MSSALASKEDLGCLWAMRWWAWMWWW